MISKYKKRLEVFHSLFLELRRDWNAESHVVVPYALLSSPPPCETLIFLHIPKTAGTTLFELIKVICRANGKLNLRVAVKSNVPPVLTVPGWNGAWGDVNNYSVQELSRQSIISGHFPFGIDEKLTQSSSYVTLLRDPVDREISSFNHHFQLGYFKSSDSIDMLLSNNQIMDNPQTRMIAGEKFCKEVRCSERTFLKAKENLRSRFLIVGVTEEFNEFLAALLALLKWPAVEYTERRVTELKLIQSISDVTRGELEQFHSFDMKLYQFVKNNWRDWLVSYIDFENLSKKRQEVLKIPWHSRLTRRYSLYSTDFDSKLIR
ncbi:MAG TPA: sulfotransferase family 2 domain-containing protein [Oligoflexia bacterium]|nr:sulfotransferase family 2 domain-containing protein [Oligoflexia bacterium]HMP47043.1 sulfotransferase family 2 domain-containing protein [Oligoflexia bacterium]